MKKTQFSKAEKQWIAEQRITRLTDGKEVLIYPMGAERYLASVLIGKKKSEYNLTADIKNKQVLMIPGYGNSAFLLAAAGAKSVTVYDKDPVTLAWIKAFKRYYHYRTAPFYPSVGELLDALTCWYPPLLKLPTGFISNVLCWTINPQALRRTYIYYMIALVRRALAANIQHQYELAYPIQFHTGEITQIIANKTQRFDTAFVPYLLGVKNGIENEGDIVSFITQLTQVVPHGSIVITPSRNIKEFRWFGQRYFTTTQHSTIQAIPELTPYFIAADKHWFRGLGLSVFGNVS